jgi:hypothetical protein
MCSHHDRLSIGGRDVFGDRVGPERESTPGPRTTRTTAKPFLSVWFRCCHAYGRMMRNAQQTHYIGRCPKCGARVTATIGPDGTPQRIFEAR